MIITEKENCTGCSACKSVCPVNAIKMLEDIDGFLVPIVDDDICIKCGKCIRVCPANKDRKSKKTSSFPITYAAINKERECLKVSSSGGIFPVIANKILNNNGVVFGCAWSEQLKAEHIFIEGHNDLTKLQGSKYVQSYIGNSYINAKEFLDSGREVLFTGTPCQIAGLNSFLNKEYDNLITIDLICHGVPSQAFFDGYLNELSKSSKLKVVDFKFRDKKYGTRYIGKAEFENSKTKKFNPSSSYYYNYFLKGHIFRESCYTCPYACPQREGDFTLGDYWGIEKYHPKFESREGSSVILVNTQKAQFVIETIKEKLELIPSDFKKASANNGPLRKPTRKNSKRDEIFKLWRSGGSELVAEKFHISAKEKFIVLIKNVIPYCIKKNIKRMVSK